MTVRFGQTYLQSQFIRKKAKIVFLRYCFRSERKGRRLCSLFPFRQISEFPTGAALLNERTAVYDEKVYRSFGGVGIAVWCTLHTGKCLWQTKKCCRQEAGWYRGIDMIVPFARFVRRDFFMSCRKRPREAREYAKVHSLLFSLKRFG